MKGGLIFSPPIDINRIFENNPGDMNFEGLLNIEE
jgi:hypothetical protein